MKTYIPLLSLFFLIFAPHINANTPQETLQEKDMVIVIASYNNKDWYIKNLDSVLSQEYDAYRVIYIDDYSPDGTAQLVQEYIDNHPEGHRVTLIKGHERRGAHANIYRAITACKNHEIVIIVDGDDWLSHSRVLKTINQYYADENVWLTYGQYQRYPANTIGICRAIPQQVIATNRYREYHWVTTHLRTFYAWLFKQVKLKDFLYQGQFVPSAGDQIGMFGMLEKSGGRFAFIPEVLYRYNRANVINVEKTGHENAQLQLDLAKYTRKKEKYTPLANEQTDYLDSLHDATADVIVFSSESPEQLHQTIQNIHNSITGVGNIYAVSQTTDFSTPEYQQVQQAFANLYYIDTNNNNSRLAAFLQPVFDAPAHYLLLTTDNDIITTSINIPNCVHALERTAAYGFFFNKTKASSTDTNYFFLYDNIYAWQFTDSDAHNDYSNTIHTTLYRKADLYTHVAKMNSLDMFLSQWTKKTVPTEVGLFYDIKPAQL
ncbi:MAG TPA: glycosyltransferase family 2 protein [Candidatus Babeliales bacterium]|nr:glycosyltransferase family 2 protein [Candidatus Babeliales bacterium]